MAAALLALGAALSGCAEMSDGMSPAFADPAKYELYDCKQLEAERKALAIRSAELQGLMAKAETGVAGSVVSELAYRNDYIAVRGQMQICGRGLAQEQMPRDAARCRGRAGRPTPHQARAALQAGSAVH